MEFNLESMKEKLFNALKQKYSNLGLSDETLQSVAESLANTGLVTDENLDTVEEIMLKGFQSRFDRMRTENANYKKEIETLKGSGGDPKKTEPKDENEEPGWFKAYREEQEEKINALTAENEKAKEEKAKADRKDLILKKAKELKISQERIDEGFLISDDMDEKAIGEYLAKVKSNEAAKSLEDRSPFSLSSTAEESKREAEEWADSLPDKN